MARMLEDGAIDNDAEKEKLEYLLKAKKWNPYCLRHSAITNDSDYLPEFAVRKKARWSMNSRQGAADDRNLQYAIVLDAVWLILSRTNTVRSVVIL
jgi:hypothetical protein